MPPKLLPKLWLCLLISFQIMGRNGYAQAPGAVPSQTGISTPAPSLPDDVMHIGKDVKPPKVIHSVDPSFTKEAVKAKISGIVQVYLWVEKDGTTSHIRVTKGLGYGLDENAVQAVSKYKFKPATKDGVAVTVDVYIDVNFYHF